MELGAHREIDLSLGDLQSQVGQGTGLVTNQCLKIWTQLKGLPPKIYQADRVAVALQFSHYVEIHTEGTATLQRLDPIASDSQSQFALSYCILILMSCYAGTNQHHLRPIAR